MKISPSREMGCYNLRWELNYVFGGLESLLGNLFYTCTQQVLN